MAPVATPLPTVSTTNTKASTRPVKTGSTIFNGTLDFASLKRSEEELKDEDETYEYNYLRPVFPDIKWAPLEVFETSDKGNFADKNNNYENLFRDAYSVTHLNPKIGTEIVGINLAELDDVQKNELALLISERVVVFFRDQPELDINKQLDLGRYWGTLHKHATTSLPRDYEKGLDEVHVIWSDENKKPYTAFPATYLWHSDVTYELQPPSYTSLKVLKGPSSGGDTLWVSGYALYDMLSPGMQKYLEGLTCLHSAQEQAQDSIRSGKPVRRDPIVTEHPIIRTHPVTGYKSLFINPGFVRTIVGVPKAESDAILNYLYELVATTQEAMVRFKWNVNDVAIWDNRVAVHSATFGFYPERRHGVRVTTHGEVPYYDPNGTSQQAINDAKIGLVRDQDGSKGGNYND